jgi:uncharacterized membrane protein
MLKDEQTVEKADRNARTIAIHFLAGFGIGLFLAAIVISYNLFFTFSLLSFQQGTIAIVGALFLGLLTALKGDRFLTILAKLLDSLAAF